MNAQMSAVASSTSGYIGEIGSPHPRQRPRSTSHETIGMLSYQRSPCPHLGQRDGGRTTDCFGSAPHRRMQTLRKLPIDRADESGVRHEDRLVAPVRQFRRHA